VADIHAQDTLELAAAEDQQPVEAFPPCAADPALDVRVRVRCPDRRSDHPDSFAAEDSAEGTAELRVAVVDQEPRPLVAIVEVDYKIALWGAETRLLAEGASELASRP